jgi:hypothetical protein
MTEHKTLLIVPGGYGDGPAVRDSARRFGLRAIGASSQQNDPAAESYDQWAFAPHVSAPDFAEQLNRVIDDHGVTDMHVTHYALWFHIQQTMPDLSRRVRLSLGRTNFDIEREYDALVQRAERGFSASALGAARHPPLNKVYAAGFLRAAFSIPGESYEDKLLALIEIARRAPNGDIVEIGSLFGRTAALFAMLANHYGLGAVLCIDPWSKDEIRQGEDRLHTASLAYDWASWRRIFEINVAPFAKGRLNYIQATSEGGAQRYGPEAAIETDALGRTQYEGAIAILHIDGNHDYAAVRLDADLWTPHVKPGGWIVFDDYEWDWGDGPRRVGDDFLATQAEALQTHFVAAGALFVQLKS